MSDIRCGTHTVAPGMFIVITGFLLRMGLEPSISIAQVREDRGATILRPSRPLSKAFVVFLDPISTSPSWQFILQSLGGFLYDNRHVTKRARFYTGGLAPQSTSHDHCPRLLASPRTAYRSPDRVAPLYHRATHPVTRLLPLAATPHRVPDRGPRARP
jgi:hypothetical protein